MNNAIPKNFRIQQQNNELLVTPNIGTNNIAWNNWNNRWLRSLHIDESTEHIISCGFPKFMNLNEGQGLYKITIEDLYKNAHKGILATEKIDGCLLIRYVQNGKIKWRTRGCIGTNLENQYEIEQFIKKYPKLNNPQFFYDISLLFEWTSPNNQIVIKYDKPNIHLIGAVAYEQNTPWFDSKIKLINWRNLQNIQRVLQTPLTNYFYLNTKNDINDLINKTVDDKNIEGYVLRFSNDQKMVKIKCTHYLTLHAVKYHLTSKKLIELWLQWYKPNYKEYETLFINQFNFEAWQYIRPVVSLMFDAIRAAYRIFDHIQMFVDQNNHQDRKTFAALAKQKYNGIKLSTCFLLRDNKPVNDKCWFRIIMQKFSSKG